jgi:hypothetical protein
MKLFAPGLDSAKFEVRRLANELRLRTHILERSEIPHMASSVDQVFRVQVAPISLGRKIRVVAQCQEQTRGLGTLGSMTA